jgi:hypothetical protein
LDVFQLSLVRLFVRAQGLLDVFFQVVYLLAHVLEGRLLIIFHSFIGLLDLQVQCPQVLLTFDVGVLCIQQVLGVCRFVTVPENEQLQLVNDRNFLVVHILVPLGFYFLIDTPKYGN